MAIDGQPAEPFLARDGRVALGPGNRVDLFIDATLAAGRARRILLGEPARNGRSRASSTAASRRAPRRFPNQPLPPNPLPERLDFARRITSDLPLDAFVPLPAPVHERPPLFSVRRGRVVVLALGNRTELAQTIHLHGHHSGCSTGSMTAGSPSGSTRSLPAPHRPTASHSWPTIPASG